MNSTFGIGDRKCWKKINFIDSFSSITFCWRGKDLFYSHSSFLYFLSFSLLIFSLTLGCPRVILISLGKKKKVSALFFFGFVSWLVKNLLKNINQQALFFFISLSYCCFQIMAIVSINNVFSNNTNNKNNILICVANSQIICWWKKIDRQTRQMCEYVKNCWKALQVMLNLLVWNQWCSRA